MDEAKLHRKAWELLLERVEDFFALDHPRHKGIMVVDDVSKEMNRSLAMKHAFFQQSGTSSGQRLRHIIEMPLFVRSELSNGIQLADLVSYNIYRAFKFGDLAYPWFRKIAPNLWPGSPASAGIPTGLKIFPPVSPFWGQAQNDLSSPWLALKGDRGAVETAPR